MLVPLEMIFFVSYLYCQVDETISNMIQQQTLLLELEVSTVRPNPLPILVT